MTAAGDVPLGRVWDLQAKLLFAELKHCARGQSQGSCPKPPRKASPPAASPATGGHGATWRMAGLLRNNTGEVGKGG